MEPIAIPSLIALAIKLWLLWSAGMQLFRNNPILGLFLMGALVMNVNEFYLLGLSEPDAPFMVILLMFYSSAIIMATAYLLMGLDTRYKNSTLNTVLLLIAVVFIVLSWGTKWFITGVELSDYSIQSQHGEFYAVLLGYILFTLVAGLVVIAKNWSDLDNAHMRRKSFGVLVGTLPIILTGMFLVLAALVGYRINAVAILSVSTSLSLLLFVYIETKYNLFQLLSYIPRTDEYELRRGIVTLSEATIKTLFKYQDNIDLKNLTANFEKEVIWMAIKALGGNKRKAAELLMISPATLHRKIGPKN